MIIRKAFVGGKRNGKVTGKLYITSSVTLATRVRGEILWAIANQFSTEKGQMYVSSFDASPRLHVKLAGSIREQYSLTFGEALIC